MNIISTASRRVLIVDDEKIIADTLALILRLNGYDPASAYSAEEAVAWCRGHKPDFLITDVVMGAMNGIELAYHVASLYPACQTLLMSGNILTASLLAAAPETLNRFLILPKPVHPEAILEFLTTLHVPGLDSPALLRKPDPLLPKAGSAVS